MRLCTKYLTIQLHRLAHARINAAASCSAAAREARNPQPGNERSCPHVEDPKRKVPPTPMERPHDHYLRHYCRSLAE